MQTTSNASLMTLGGFYIDLSSAMSYLFRDSNEFITEFSVGTILLMVSSH
jgi:hypothetical protein